MRSIARWMVGFASVGVVCWLIAFLNPSYVDQDGFLVEPFSWIAAGSIMFSIAGACALIVLGLWVAKRGSKRNNVNEN